MTGSSGLWIPSDTFPFLARYKELKAKQADISGADVAALWPLSGCKHAMDGPHPVGSHPELCLEAVLEAESQVKGLEGQGRLRQSLPMSQARPSAGSGAQPSGEGPPLHPPLPLAPAGSPRMPTLSLYLLGILSLYTHTF